jgi:hypothetical protein
MVSNFGPEDPVIVWSTWMRDARPAEHTSDEAEVSIDPRQG